ncbi:MAG TPA: ATPase, T2SS/T4P/T4SS family [Actinomycetes bacterium]|nr:ATPase, T2SS/T4P/T4SS family [Actinomycetes bacterium]
MSGWLEALVNARGSDRHVKVGSSPRMRVDGRLVVLDGPQITSELAEALLSDTEDFSIAMRAAMRQDPDVILVGEIRDAETLKAALAAAETGHLVLSTLHTTDAAETVNRCIDLFPPYQQRQVRLSLAAALRGIVGQRLVRREGDGGRVAVLEILVNTGRTAEAIADPERLGELVTIMTEGTYYGMQTFDQHLIALYRDGVVTLDDALGVASNPHDLRVALRNQGLVA